MSHDEGHLHLAAAGLLRKQLGLRVVGADECIAGILVQLLGLLKITLASASSRMSALPVDGMVVIMNRMPADFGTFEPEFL